MGIKFKVFWYCHKSALKLSIVLSFIVFFFYLCFLLFTRAAVRGLQRRVMRERGLGKQNSLSSDSSSQTQTTPGVDLLDCIQCGHSVVFTCLSPSRRSCHLKPYIILYSSCCSYMCTYMKCSLISFIALQVISS